MTTYILTCRPGHSVNQIKPADQTRQGIHAALVEAERNHPNSEIAVVESKPGTLASYSPKSYRFNRPIA